MAAKQQSEYVSGKVKWFRALGEPHMDEMAGRTMWSFDFHPDDVKAMAKMIADRKINKTLKDKGEGKFIAVTRNGKKRDGEDMPPIIIVDAEGKKWDQNTKVGNGSAVTLKFHLNESKYGNLFWVEAVKIDEHIPYEGGGELFPGVAYPKKEEEAWGDDEEDEAPAPAKPAKKKPVVVEDDDLDDEIID